MEFQPDRAWLGRVLAELPVFILVVDRDRTIRYINRVEPGYDADQVVGMHVGEVLFPASRDDLEGVLDAVFATGETTGYEVRAHLADGSAAWYGGQAIPLRVEGEVVAAVIRADNISELKAVQEELRRAKKLLPVCAWCDRIRTEDGSWEGIGTYLKRVADTDVTHGLCPECERREVEELDGGDGSSGSAA